MNGSTMKQEKMYLQYYYLLTLDGDRMQQKIVP